MDQQDFTGTARRCQVVHPQIGETQVRGVVVALLEVIDIHRVVDVIVGGRGEHRLAVGIHVVTVVFVIGLVTLESDHVVPQHLERTLRNRERHPGHIALDLLAVGHQVRRCGILLAAVVEPLRLRRVAVCRIDIEPEALRPVFFQQGLHAFGQDFRILRHVLARHRVDRLLCRVRIGVFHARLPAGRHRRALPVPGRNRTIGIACHLGANRREILAKTCRLLGADRRQQRTR